MNSEPEYIQRLRLRMVEQQIMRRGIDNQRVIEAMSRVPRHEFLPGEPVENAYQDGAVVVGHGQTCSQPYVVAYMTSWCDPHPTDRALEIGTGSGYQAAVLAEICREVVTIERIEPLAETARRRLSSLGYQNVRVECRDGYEGCPEGAPFDIIVITAAAAEVPPPLFQQLGDDGRLIVPLGRGPQRITRFTRQFGTLYRENGLDVRFVPFVSEHQDTGHEDHEW